jgi:hypothetical protein
LAEKMLLALGVDPNMLSGFDRFLMRDLRRYASHQATRNCAVTSLLQAQPLRIIWRFVQTPTLETLFSAP